MSQEDADSGMRDHGFGRGLADRDAGAVKPRAPTPELFGMDAYTPAQIAARIERVGVSKARLPLLTMFVLAILGGVFIGLGAMYCVVVRADAGLGLAARQLLGGLAFALGLLLVVVAGAELFTGNNLLVMAWADRRISGRELLRNWTVVLVGNAVGAGGLALLVYWSGQPAMHAGAIAAEYQRIAQAKAALGPLQAFLLGVLCNALVCLAVWMAMAGRSVTDKAVAVVFPVSAFVAAGFEHSVANFYLMPMALLLQGADGSLGWMGLLGNLLPVLLGNVVGGSLLVGLVYHLVYHGGPDAGS